MDGKVEKKTVGGFGGGAAKESVAQQQQQQQQQQQPVEIEKVLKEVVGPMLQSFCGSLTASVEKLVTRIERLEAKVEGNREVSLGGGGAKGVSFDRVDGDGEDGFRDASQFFGRGSNSSANTLGSNARDAGTKLERPKFTVKNAYSKTPEGAKTEVLEDSDYLEFFDNYDHYVNTWEALPINENVSYPNKDCIAMLSIPPKYARMLSDRLKLVFAPSDLQFMTLAQVQKATYWKDQTTEQLRIRIGQKLEEEVSTLGSLDILKRIKWTSKYGLIDSVAFADYSHNIKKEVRRIQSGGKLSVNKIQLKDIIIEAIPDRSFQRELCAKFGGTGCLFMEVEDFAINLVFDQIEERITSVTKQGLRALVNKSTRERESGGQVDPRPKNAAWHPKVAQVVEIEAEIQDQVNAALVGERECRNKGVGSDKLLKCRFLGGEKETCTFSHPASDLALKGKGVSKDVPNPQWLNTGKKAYNLVGAFGGEDEECEEHEGGSDGASDEEEQ